MWPLAAAVPCAVCPLFLLLSSCVVVTAAAATASPNVTVSPTAVGTTGCWRALCRCHTFSPLVRACCAL